MIRYFFCFLIFCSCSSRMATQTATNYSALEEVRIALIDVRQAFSTQQMEISLLEEKIAKLKPATQTSSSSLEARIRQMEKTLETIDTDLHQLSSHANQVTQSLVEYRNRINALDKELKLQDKRLDEIVQLKSTLNSISKAIEHDVNGFKVHKVSSGESLEKIARQYSTTVEALKKLNGLSSTTILIGQEIKIPE